LFLRKAAGSTVAKSARRRSAWPLQILGLAAVQAGIAGIRREAGEAGDLAAGEAAEPGQANDQGERGARADAGDSEDQIDAPGQVGMGLQLRDDAPHLGRASRLQPRNVGGDGTPVPRVVDLLEPGLEAGDVLLDLLNEGEGPGQRG